MRFSSGVCSAARERTRRHRRERGVQQHAGRSLGDDGQHARPEEEQDTQWKTGKILGYTHTFAEEKDAVESTYRQE